MKRFRSLVRFAMLGVTVVWALAPAPARAAYGILRSADSSTGVFAPLNRPGPSLDVAPQMLAASLSCSSNVLHASREPILLVPGTTLTPYVNYSWNYERAFAQMGFPYCAVTLPNNAMADVQTAGEYVVYAIRQMNVLSGRKVDILGFSQGGMVPRWALRFWPDTRALVDSFVALDPSNHGTVDADAICTVTCAPAFWQQATTSNFYRALNSGTETFAGISYTVVFSRTDEVVVPNLTVEGSSSLHLGAGAIANIPVQSICPLDVSEHLAMGSYDAVGFALAVDAFTHLGPASPSRISRDICTEPFQPGVDPVTFPTTYAAYVSYVGSVVATTPTVRAEPSLASYVFSGAATTDSIRRALY